jgi:hypothetical protein
LQWLWVFANTPVYGAKRLLNSYAKPPAKPGGMAMKKKVSPAETAPQTPHPIVTSIAGNGLVTN